MQAGRSAARLFSTESDKTAAPARCRIDSWKGILPMGWCRVVVYLLLPAAFCDVPVRRVSKEAVGTLGAEEAYRRGIRYADGDGVAQDYAMAARAYRTAAEMGHIGAQYNQAYLYEQGLGVAEDAAMAASWYRRAAEQGDSQAQNNLGVLYSTGSGVEKNEAEALRLYGMAAEQENLQAVTNLGSLYLQGRGTERDFARAMALFRRAAEGGNAVAQNNLGLMYANGQGVERDYEEGYVWLVLAAERLEAAGKVRDQVGTRLTAEGVERARRRAAEWRARRQ